MAGKLAYLDPGTGSMVIGAVAAAGASVAVAAKAFGSRVFKRGGNKVETPAPVPATEPAPEEQAPA